MNKIFFDILPSLFVYRKLDSIIAILEFKATARIKDGTSTELVL